MIWRKWVEADGCGLPRTGINGVPWRKPWRWVDIYSIFDGWPFLTYYCDGFVPEIVLLTIPIPAFQLCRDTCIAGNFTYIHEIDWKYTQTRNNINLQITQILDQLTSGAWMHNIQCSRKRRTLKPVFDSCSPITVYSITRYIANLDNIIQLNKKSY